MSADSDMKRIGVFVRNPLGDHITLGRVVTTGCNQRACTPRASPSRETSIPAEVMQPSSNCYLTRTGIRH